MLKILLLRRRILFFFKKCIDNCKTMNYNLTCILITRNIHKDYKLLIKYCVALKEDVFMKKKKFLSILITLLMIFSPIVLSSMKVHAADDVYTVILKSGNGTGSDVIIKSSDDGAMAESEAKANHGQFFTEGDATYFCTPLSAPKSFQPPSENQCSFSGWVSEEGEYLHDEDVKMNDYDNNTLVLTALWNDSYFELETTDELKISGPGYTDFTYTLKDLHLGTTDLGNGNTQIVDSVELEFKSGTLEIGGKTIPYSICPTYGTADKKAISEPLTEEDIGKELKMSIYISPKDYEKVQSGTCTIKLKCTGIYTCHPYYSANPDDHSPGYTFETKKFRGNSVVTLTLPLTLISTSTINSDASNDDSILTLTSDTENDEKVDFPKTEDSTNTIPLIAILATSILGFTLVMMTRDKIRKFQN